jgi:hypothetical protein
MQTEIDFVHTVENNSESKQILNANREHLSAQCEKVLELLTSGKRLTVRDAMIEYGIGDLRRRVKDLKENGYNVKGDLIEGRFKIYYLDGTDNQ